MDQSIAERLSAMTIQMPPFIMAVVFHEWAHGFIANQWGDPTARDQGRLTLNPIPHLDPIGTLLFPMINMITGIPILIGWAKPVPIDPRRFRKFRPGLFWVSIAGVGMNFILATISAAVFCSLWLWMPHDFYLFEPLIHMAQVSISLNFALGIFNLIPIPPLDGSKIIESMLSLPAMRKYEEMARYSTFILLGLILTGALSILSVPINFMTVLTLNLVATLFGLGTIA